jgi:uncharacterized SAM-binding protein YcdF (DUF218 family)
MKLRIWLDVLRWLGFALIVVFLVSVFTPFWNMAAEYLAMPEVIQKADAIVVLGAGILEDGTLGDESLRRMVHGIDLFNRGLAPVIIFLGPSNGASSSEAEVRRSFAIRVGVPPDRIIAISNVQNTREESEQVALTLSKSNSKSILLVTEALHIRRAMGLFDRAGVRSYPAPSENLHRILVTPRGRMRLMWRVLMQLGGIVYYQTVGYL